MAASILSFLYALVLFAMAGEVQTTWLKVVGIVLAGLMTIVGAINGWNSARK